MPVNSWPLMSKPPVTRNSSPCRTMLSSSPVPEPERALFVANSSRGISANVIFCPTKPPSRYSSAVDPGGMSDRSISAEELIHVLTGELQQAVLYGDDRAPRDRVVRSHLEVHVDLETARQEQRHRCAPRSRPILRACIPSSARSRSCGAYPQLGWVRSRAAQRGRSWAAWNAEELSGGRTCGSEGPGRGWVPRHPPTPHI